MNPKIQKTIAEIEKIKDKITELTARLRDLEAQRIDMENTEIVGPFRSANVAPQDLADFIGNLKAQTARRAAPQLAPVHQAEQEVSENEA